MAVKQYPKVNFHYLQKFPLRRRRELKQFISSILKKEGRSLQSLDYIFCSDEYLWQINLRHLKHNTYTDIITFDLADSQQSHAEIYISVERVKENAEKFGVSFEAELHRVIFHGALHLCGYGDKKSKEVAEMRKKERLYLKSHFK